MIRGIITVPGTIIKPASNEGSRRRSGHTCRLKPSPKGSRGERPSHPARGEGCASSPPLPAEHQPRSHGREGVFSAGARALTLGRKKAEHTGCRESFRLTPGKGEESRDGSLLLTAAPGYLRAETRTADRCRGAGLSMATPGGS